MITIPQIIVIPETIEITNFMKGGLIIMSSSEGKPNIIVM